MSNSDNEGQNQMDKIEWAHKLGKKTKHPTTNR